MLEHLRREHQELQHLAAADRDNADWEMAAWHEQEAAEVEDRIKTLERADGLTAGVPMYGSEAA